MKKLYNSRDLSGMSVFSKYYEDHDLIVSTFRPYAEDPFNTKGYFDKIENICKEIEKLSYDDIKNSNFSSIDSKILSTEFIILKSHSHQKPGFFIIPFLEYNFDSFYDYFDMFLGFSSLAIISNLKKEEEKNFNLFKEYTLKDIINLAYTYYERDKEQLKKFQKEFEQTIRFLFNIDNLKEFKDISPNNLLFIYEFLHKENSGIFKHRSNIDISYEISDLYRQIFSNFDFSNSKIEDAKLIVKKVKKLSGGNKINLEYSKNYRFSSIFELLYVELIHLLEKDNSY